MIPSYIPVLVNDESGASDGVAPEEPVKEVHARELEPV